MQTGLIDDRHSYSGALITLGDVPISWLAVKQKCVALSSAESEYVALNLATREVLRLTRILKELQLNVFVNEPPNLFCDNRSAMCLASNRVENFASKHIEIRYHYVREQCDKKLINLKYVPSKSNLADILTKSLKKVAHESAVQMLNMQMCK